MPAKVQELFKKQDVIEFIAHEAQLINEGALSCVSMFRTPQALMKRFAASGEGGLVEAFRADSAPLHGMENAFALPVAEYRDMDSHDATAKTLIDFMWNVWCGCFDDDIMELCVQDMQSSTVAGPFL